jgi:hypothetical protein
MPTPNQILETLTTIANDAIVAAVLWHLAIAAALVWLGSGWRPTSRVATALLAAPLLSVAAFALAYDNPFNAVVFIATALALLLISASAEVARVDAGPAWAAALGGAMIAYAWVYPHFLQTSSPIAYLYAAPVGLVPCPSLALVIGLALVGGGVDRRAAGVLALLGLVYGVIGVALLGVALDVGLIAGAVGLGVLVVQRGRLRRPATWARGAR